MGKTSHLERAQVKVDDGHRKLNLEGFLISKNHGMLGRSYGVLETKVARMYEELQV